jgi:hypothetical protein
MALPSPLAKQQKRLQVTIIHELTRTVIEAKVFLKKLSTHAAKANDAAEPGGTCSGSLLVPAPSHAPTTGDFA